MTDIMTRRQRQVAEAAGPVFLRQGITRTTMGDLASAAGLSRQGLYLAYPNKEAVFAAAVRVLYEGLDASFDEILAGRAGLKPRLAAVCDRWLEGVFDLQRSTPDARDMDDLSFPVVQEAYGRFVARLTALIAEAGGEVVPAKERGDLARSLVYFIRGYSASAADGAEMRRLTAFQIDLVAGRVESALLAQSVVRASAAILG